MLLWPPHCCLAAVSRSAAHCYALADACARALGLGLGLGRVLVDAIGALCTDDVDDRRGGRNTDLKKWRGSKLAVGELMCQLDKMCPLGIFV